MNKSVISFAAALLSASALVAATPAQADDIFKYDGTSNINASLSGAAPELTVSNIANTNKLADLQLAIQEAKIAVGVSGIVGCTGVEFENWKKREGHFLSSAAFGVGRTGFAASVAVPNSSDINRTAASDSKVFNLPVNQLGHSQIQINPVAIVMAAANQAPNKVQYLRQNHVINVQIPLRTEGNCQSYVRNKITKKTLIEASSEKSFHTKDVTLKIKYQGDPDLQFVLNAELANQNPGGVQAAEQNFINITGASVIEGIKNLKTKCPGNAQFKVRVTGQGNGHVKIQVADKGATVQTSGAIELVNGKAEFAFGQHLGYKAPGQGDDHSYRIYYSKKTKNENFFPAAYQSIGSTFEWSHICFKPISVGVGLGGNGGIQSQGQQGNSNTPATPGFKPSAPARGLGKAAPSAGKPARAMTKPARAKSRATGTPVVPTKKLLIPATPAKPARATN